MTAKKFLESKEPNTFIVPIDYLIEFAKYHVKQALKEASEKVIIEGHPFEYELDKDSILNAYPLDLIV